jgi:hypothetical protein
MARLANARARRPYAACVNNAFMSVIWWRLRLAAFAQQRNALTCNKSAGSLHLIRVKGLILGPIGSKPQ